MSTSDHIHGLSGQLEKLTSYSHNMLKNAESGNWEKVIETELQRRILLNALFSTTDVRNIPEIENVTREMLKINQQLEKLATSAHQQAATDAASINKGRHAISAYTKNFR